jgi:hypothetical protein
VWKSLKQRSCSKILHIVFLQRTYTAILYRNILQGTCQEIIDRDVPQRSWRREPAQDLSHKTSYRYPYKGISHRNFYIDPVKEVLHTIFSRNLQNLPWYFFVMFFAARFGVFCRDLFFNGHGHVSRQQTVAVVWYLSGFSAVPWRCLEGVLVVSRWCLSGVSMVSRWCRWSVGGLSVVMPCRYHTGVLLWCPSCIVSV